MVMELRVIGLAAHGDEAEEMRFLRGSVSALVA